MTSCNYGKLEANTTIPTCDIEKLEPNTTIPTSSGNQEEEIPCFALGAMALGMFVFLALILFLISVWIWAIAQAIDGSEIRIESLSVSNFNVNSSSHTINGNWNVTLDFYTGVERSVFNRDISLSIFYESKMLDATRIPSLKQGWRNHQVIEAGFSVVNYNIHTLVNMMNQDIARGLIRFNVKVEEMAYGGWSCNNIMLAITTASSGSLSGKMIGGSKGCL